MKYKLLFDNNRTGIEEEINHLLNDGWILHGQLVVRDNQLLQAMIKPDPTGWVDLAPMVTQDLR